MTFSLFRIAYVPIYTVLNINRAWIVQDRLLTEDIKANIEVGSCTYASMNNKQKSYSICVSRRDVIRAKGFLAQLTQ